MQMPLGYNMQDFVFYSRLVEESLERTLRWSYMTRCLKREPQAIKASFGIYTRLDRFSGTTKQEAEVTCYLSKRGRDNRDAGHRR